MEFQILLPLFERRPPLREHAWRARLLRHLVVAAACFMRDDEMQDRGERQRGDGKKWYHYEAAAVPDCQ